MKNTSNMGAKKNLEAQLVRIKIEQDGNGFFYATSPDLKGLVVSEANIPALDTHIERAIIDMYKACGEDVIVSKLRDGIEDNYRPWIAFPIETAKMALAAH